jgi:hypothetical protein
MPEAHTVQPVEVPEELLRATELERPAELLRATELLRVALDCPRTELLRAMLELTTVLDPIALEVPSLLEFPTTAAPIVKLIVVPIGETLRMSTPEATLLCQRALGGWRR